MEKRASDENDKIIHIIFFSVRAFIKNGVDPREKAGDGRTCMEMTQNSGTKTLLNDIFNKEAADAAKDEL